MAVNGGRLILEMKKSLPYDQVFLLLKILRGILHSHSSLCTPYQIEYCIGWCHCNVLKSCALRFHPFPLQWGTYCVGASNCPLLRKLGLFAQIQLLLHSQATGFHLQLKCCNIIVALFLFFQLMRLLLRRHGRVMRTILWLFSSHFQCC